MGRALQAYARRVSTRGEHGVLATINTKAIVAWRDLRRQCGQILGRPVPEPDVAWPKGDRIIVPRLYGSTQANGELPIECISEGNQPTWLHYRLLGGGTWESQRLGPLRGWVQAGVVPAQVVQPPGLELVLSHEQRAPESGPMDAGSASMARFTVTVMPAAPMETAPRARATTSVASVDGLQVTAIQDGVFPVTLSWSDLPEADWFSVFRGDERVAETAVPLFFDSPRKPEVSYTVKAHRDGRVLAAQTIRVRLPDPTIHEKPHVQTQVKNAGVVLSWPTSSPAEAYEVYRCAPDAPADGSHPIIQLEPSAGGTCTWRDRPPAGRWEYRVVPLNLVGRAGPAWQGVVDFAPVPVEPVLSLGLGAVPQEANVVGRVPCTADGAQLGEGHLVLKHRSEWDLNQAMTLSFEFKAQDVSGMPVLLCHGAWQIDGWFVQILNGALIVRTPNGDASGPAVEAGRWYAVVFIFDGDHLLLYVDGEQQPVQDGKVKAVPTTRDLLIGQYATAAPEFAFHGAIRKVMIYPDVVLPAPTR